MTEVDFADPASIDGAPAGEPPGPKPPGSGPRTGIWHRLLSTRPVASSMTFIVFALVFVAYSVWLGNGFTDSDQRILDVHQNVPLLLIGLALTVCLICGQFDLSVGSMATLTTYLTVGLAVNQHWNFALILVVCVLIGVAGGLLNAFLVVTLRVNAFIATLGTGGVFVGMSRVYSGGTQLAPTGNGPAPPTWFSGTGSFGSYQTKVPSVAVWVVLIGLIAAASLVILERVPEGRKRQAQAGLAAGAAVIVLLFATILNHVTVAIPYTVLFLIVVATILWVVLRYTTFGRYLHATGGNSEAARLAGVHVRRLTTSAFVISGLLSAVAGIVLAATQGSASPDIGVNFLLPAFAAAFLSTVLLSTGQFHVWGTVIGGIFLITVSQGLIIGGINFTWTDVINGVVLAGAVALSSALRRETAH